MMLMISPEDFKQLSPACQQELLSLLTREASLGKTTPAMDDAPPDWDADEFLAEEDASYAIEAPVALTEAPARAPTPDATEGAHKQVLDISPATARDLIANISDKSLSVLTQFANGLPVTQSSLIGTDAPYRDLNELKRSLVGAVNRRLRTVTDNRAAVLFASSRDRQRIHITPRSAASLRQAMRLPEPLPTLAFVNASGHALAHGHTASQALLQHLEQAWKHMALRPLEPRCHLLPAQIYPFLADHGFSLRCGKPITDNDGLNAHYAWEPESQLPGDFISLIDPQGNVRLSTEDGTLRLRVFASHPDCADVLASLAVQ